MVSVLDPIGAEIRRLSDDPAHVDQVLLDGADRASAIATPILDEIKSAVGLV